MPVDPEDIETGSIVWAIVRDRNGFRKRRPAIVLNAREDIATDLPLVLMAITTTFADPANCVELPWNNDRRKVGRGLARRSAAVMDWLDTVYLDEVDEVIGVVPKRIMERIHARLRDSGNA